MYNYLLFRWLFMRNCDEETKAAETILSKDITFATQNGKDKKQKGRLKCECFCNFSFLNCCAVVKEKEKQLAKMCLRSAKRDYTIYEYILHDCKLFDWRIK